MNRLLNQDDISILLNSKENQEEYYISKDGFSFMIIYVTYENNIAIIKYDLQYKHVSKVEVVVTCINMVLKHLKTKGISDFYIEKSPLISEEMVSKILTEINCENKCYTNRK